MITMHLFCMSSERLIYFMANIFLVTACQFSRRRLFVRAPQRIRYCVGTSCATSANAFVPDLALSPPSSHPLRLCAKTSLTVRMRSARLAASCLFCQSWFPSPLFHVCGCSPHAVWRIRNAVNLRLEPSLELVSYSNEVKFYKMN